MALFAPLPDKVQQAYRSYGDDFITGYLALNEGDFETAADFLARAMKANPGADSYIPLELATAYLNLGQTDDARQLLERFVRDCPDALPAYQMLCEIYWEQGRHDSAQALLSAVPSPLTASVAVILLQGETLSRSGDPEGAKTLYRYFLKDYGWHDRVAQALADVYEEGSEVEEARGLYGELVSRCSGCGSRVDPQVRQKYADLCYASGDFTSTVIEAYLTLAREMPQYAAENYDKVSRIYAAKGNTTEARRFRSFSEQARQRRQPAS
jgi:tetratricopeptide (TPR) repeat protein